MNKELHVGIVGLDTSHSPAFARLLNDPADPHAIEGARVTVAFPGGSEDFELSKSRVDRFTSDVRKLGVRILESPEQIAEAADLILLESVDGRMHCGLLERLARFGKPVFVDKPLALSSAEAVRMIEMSRAGGFALMSSSALRYCDVIADAIGDRASILGCDVYGPLAFEPTQPGWFWYGLHTVEMTVAAMGVGCAHVQVVKTEQTEVVTALWRDGRVATLCGVCNAHSVFGITLHRADGVRTAASIQAKVPFYTSLLRTVMHTLPANQWAIAPREMLETIRIVEAINSARETGKMVELKPAEIE